jgi:anti-sigma regulatory factor (Ser/Thr protein kinase)
VTRPSGGWPDFSAEIPASATQLAALRRAARRWMETVDVPAAAALDVLIALSEAASNAVLHAYDPGSPGRIRVRGHRRGDELELVVEDDGSWRDRSVHHDGRGLDIIEAVSTVSVVERRAGGSRVVFRCELPSSPARA